jgi:hypothetical protein
MSDIVEKIILDDSQFIKSFEQLGDLIEQTGKDVVNLNKDVNKSTSDISKKAVAANEAINQSVIKTSRSMREARADLANQIKDYSILGVSLGDVKSKTTEFINILKTSREALIGNINPTKTQADGIERLASVFGGGRGAILAFVKSLNLVKGAILATGIGALILGLTGLVTWLTKSQSGMDYMGQKMAYVSGASEVLKKKLIGVGEGIVDSFSKGTIIKDFGDLLKNNIETRLEGIKKIFSSFSSGSFLDGLKQAGSGLQETITGIKTDTILNLGKEVDAAASKFENIEKRMQGVRVAQKAVEVQTALNRAELERLKKAGEDTTLSFKERELAIKSAAAIELKTLKQNEALARTELSLVREKNSLSEKTNETLAEEQAIEIKLANFRGESFGKQTELQNQLNGLRREQIDLIDGQLAKLKQLNEELFKAASDAGLVSREEERQSILNKQLENLEEQRQSYEKLGLALGKDVAPQLELINKLIQVANVESKKIDPIDFLGQATNSQIESLKSKISELKITSIEFNVDTTEEQKKIQKEIDEILKKPLQSNKPKIEIDIDYVINSQSDDKNFSDGLLDFIDGIENFDDLLSTTLDKVFGKNSGKAKEFIQGLSSGFNQFASLMNESLNIQIANNGKIIQDRKNQRTEIEEQLDYEKELNELGLANNLEIKKNEINALLAEEEKYQKQNDELKQKALKQQLVLDTIAQTQSFITSAIQIIKGFSNIPIVGLPLGIAAVAGLGRFFVKTKVDAFKATKLNEGIKSGEQISDYFGQVDKHGDSDKVQQGYKVIRASDGMDTNVIISGREHLWGEDVSRRHHKFLEAMERGLIADSEIDDFMYHLKYKNSKSINPNRRNQDQKTFTKNTVSGKTTVQWTENGKTYASVIDVSNIADGTIIELG